MPVDSRVLKVNIQYVCLGYHRNITGGTTQIIYMLHKLRESYLSKCSIQIVQLNVCDYVRNCLINRPDFACANTASYWLFTDYETTYYVIQCYESCKISMNSSPCLHNLVSALSSILVVILAHLEAPQQHHPILLVVAEGNNPVMTKSHHILFRRIELKMCMLRWWCNKLRTYITFRIVQVTISQEWSLMS